MLTDILSRTVSKLSQIIVQILDTAFGAPFGGGGLMGNVHCSSWAHGKACSGLPIPVNWTYFCRSYGWGATNEYWLEIDVFEEGWPVSVKFSRIRVCPPRTIFARIDRPVNTLQLCRWQY